MARKKSEKTEFGEYLVAAIKDAGMSQAEFIAAVGMARPYFYDILKGSPPLREMLEKMFAVLVKQLPPSEERHSKFMNLAAKCRGEIPADIQELIKAHPDQWDNVRVALTEMLSSQR